MNASAYGRDVEDLIGRDARVWTGRDVPDRITARFPRRQASLGKTPHRQLDVVNLHEVKLDVLARRDVAEPAGVLLGDICECAELLGGQQTLRDLDPQHRRIGVLPLAVRAAYEAEFPPRFRRHVAVLVLLEHAYEFVDIGFTREREPTASERVWIVLS